MATSDETGRAQQGGSKQASQQPAPDPATQKVVDLLVSILEEVKRQVTGQAPSHQLPKVPAELQRIREALLGPQSQDKPTQASGT